MDAEQSQSDAADRVAGDGAAGASATGDGAAGASVADDGVADDGEARGAAPKPARRPASEQPNIPVVPFDETDAAWGEYPQDSDDWLRQQRPPHHGG